MLWLIFRSPVKSAHDAMHQRTEGFVQPLTPIPSIPLSLHGLIVVLPEPRADRAQTPNRENASSVPPVGGEVPLL
jgi:hypothetical protein